MMRTVSGRNWRAETHPPFARDARFYQIISLALLLAYGKCCLNFEIGFGQLAIILGAALLAQFLWARLCRLPAFDPRSALISGLSLGLLLRTNSLLLAS